MSWLLRQVFLTTIALFLALPAAYYLWRLNTRYSRLLATLTALPFMLPPVIIAVGFLLFWAALGHIGQFENTVIAHGLLFSALPLVTISVDLSAIDRSLLAAARTRGRRSGIPHRGLTPDLAFCYFWLLFRPSV